MHNDKHSYLIQCKAQSWKGLITKINSFTLIELLAVIAILATLTAIAVPGYSAYLNKARMTKVIAEIRMIEKEILAFQICQI